MFTTVLSFLSYSINFLYFFITWFFFKYYYYCFSDSLACLYGKTAIVTGGNRGIGFVISTLLASRGCTVIIADVENSENSVKKIKEKTGNPNISYRYLDLSSLNSVRKFSKDICMIIPKLDILINNAGLICTSVLKTEDNLNPVMQINYFSPFLLTHLLLEPLKAGKSSRVVFIGSGLAPFSNLSKENYSKTLNQLDYEKNEDGTFIKKETYQSYSNSKLCDILAAQEFSKKFKNINFNSSDPGIAPTTLITDAENYHNQWIKKFFKTTKIVRLLPYLYGGDEFGCAQTTFHLASSEKLKKENGQHYFRCRKFIKPKILYDQEFCDMIWKKTEELVKLKPEEKL